MFMLINPPWYLVGVIIGWILRPIFWIIAVVCHIAWLIIKRIVSVLFDGFLIGTILVLGLIGDMYRRLMMRYPHVDNAMPTIVLFTILAVVMTMIVTR